MSFWSILVLLVSEGVRLARIGEKKIKIQNKKFDTPYWFYCNPVAEFQFKISSIFKKNYFPSKFGWKIKHLCIRKDF